MINYVTNAQLCDIVRENLYKIPHDIDGVIGIPRGGMFIASIVSEFLNVPLYSVDGFLNGTPLGGGAAMSTIGGSGSGKFVVVDDSASSGKSFSDVRGLFAELPYKFIYVAAVCDDSKNLDSVDIVLSYVNEFRLFELNIFRTPYVRAMIFDIDGVLCEEPPSGLDFNEDEYIRFIRNARPKIPLLYEAMAVCTQRILKYADHTADWLKRNNIRYGNLYMLDIESVERKMEYAKRGMLINIKAEAYKMHKDAILFVESNMDEAVEIYNETGRAVLCTDTNILLQ